MDIKVRYAERSELGEVNRLREMVNRLHVEGRPDWFRPDFSNELKDFIYGFYDDENNDVIVATIDGVICGFASVQYIEHGGSPYSMPKKFYHIMEFGVDEAYRRKGVATALIEFCKEDAKNRGIHRIELDYWAFNEDAEKFYEAAGFKVFRKYTEMIV